MIIRKFLLLCLLLFFTKTSIFAQINKDTELWSGAAVQVRINPKMRFDMKEQFRFNDTISSLKLSFTQFGFRYTLKNHISFKTLYRYIVRPQKNNRQRWLFDIAYKWKKKGFPLSVGYRLRFEDEREASSGDKFTFLRNRFTCKYNLSKPADPFVAYEGFYRFNHRNEFRSLRFTTGIVWRLGKQIDLETFYRTEKTINVNNPERDNIFGIMLTGEIGM